MVKKAESKIATLSTAGRRLRARGLESEAELNSAYRAIQRAMKQDSGLTLKEAVDRYVEGDLRSTRAARKAAPARRPTGRGRVVGASSGAMRSPSQIYRAQYARSRNAGGPATPTRATNIAQASRPTATRSAVQAKQAVLAAGGGAYQARLAYQRQLRANTRRERAEARAQGIVPG